jgi:hypothetical protein
LLASRLMSRKRTVAHQQVFKLLDDFCSKRADPVQNAGAARWIETPSVLEKSFLTDAKRVIDLQFTATRRAIFYVFREQSYCCTVGFEHAQPFWTIEELAVNGGLFTAIVADLLPRPIASTTAIRNVIEAQDKLQTAAYIGHDVELIAPLFPQIKIFTCPLVSTEEAYRVFFRFCVLECDHGDYWVQNELVAALIELCDLDSAGVPYQTLCRSIFDADPAGMYLGLYRCIEAIYALKSAKILATELKIAQEWNELAIVLEQRLGWRPQEASSLNGLLVHVPEGVLRDIFIALGVPCDAIMPALREATGAQIYKLRNALVHYRPIHHRNEYQNIDWNRLCIAMSTLVQSIYQELFIKQEADPV